MTILIIDTNIWVYYCDEDSPEQKSVVRSVEAALRSEQITINTIIVTELAHFLTKNLGPVSGGEKLSLFVRFPLVISDFDYRNALDCIEKLERYSHVGVGGRDATVLAMMSAAGVKKIMTHDEALKKVDWLKVVDPPTSK